MSNRKPTVLIVDDEQIIQRACQRALEDSGYRILLADSVQGARDVLSRETVDACLMDVRLPDGDGIEMVPQAKRLSPGVEVIVMTGHGGVEDAVAAVKVGAYDFLTKPFDPVEKISISVSKAVERKKLRDRATRLEREVDAKYGFESIVGSSPAMNRAVDLARDVAYSTSSILIRGESGTGKELVARAIHRASPRKDGSFVVVNCGALPENLIESELFGHVKGSFTGALSDKRGLFEEASGGTIFLDEIGEMPVSAQVRLLRVLQDGEVRPVGSNEARSVDVRVLTATNVDLAVAIRENRFREDLFYRLNVITVDLPPLRARRDDVPVLAIHFLEKYAKKLGKPIEDMTDEVVQVLAAYAWPGNVRELENAIERACVLTKGKRVGAECLPEYLFQGIGSSGHQPGGASAETYTSIPYRAAKDRAVREFDRGYVSALLRATKGNMAEAARVAGLDRSNFRKIVNRAGVDYREFQSGRGKESGSSSVASLAN